jgi:Polysaccharide lyase
MDDKTGMRPHKTLLAALMGLALLAIPVLAATTSSATGTTTDNALWNGDWEDGGVPPGVITGGGSGDSSYLRVEQSGGPGTVSLATSPVAGGKYSGKFTMPAGSQRAQAVADYFWTPDDKGSVDLWFSTSLYMPQEWDLNQVNTSSSQFLSLVSFRSDAANGSMNVDGHKGHLWLRRNTIFDWPDGMGTDMIDLGPITKGKWMNLVFHIKFSTTNVGAVREVWRDGTFMGRKTNANTVAGTHRFRVGVYQGTGVTQDRTLYVDEARIGTSRASVDATQTALAEPTSSTTTSTATPTTTTTTSPTSTTSTTSTTSATSTTSTSTSTSTSTAPSFVGSSNGVGNAAEATAMRFATPTGARAGTQLVAGLSIRGNPRLTAPTGWVKVTQGAITNVSNNSVWTYRCPAAGCAASYTFKIGTGAGMSGSLVAYDGVSSVKPVDTAATRVNASSKTSSTPSLVTTSAATRLVAVHAITGQHTFSSPSSMTSRSQSMDPDGKYRSSIGIADQVQATSGTTGTRTATFSGSGANTGALIALR